MKNKILSVVILLVFFVSAGYVKAEGQGSSTDGSLKINLQDSTQDKNLEVETDDSEKVDVQNSDSNESSGLGVESKTSVQQKIQNENEDSSNSEIKNENQIKNEGESSNIKNSEKEGDSNNNVNKGDIENNNDENQIQSTERRSTVANAIQEILKIADKDKGIGEQVKVIAQAQNENENNLEDSLQKIQSRNSFVKFFIGPKYSEIKNAENALAKNREQISALNQLKEKVTVTADLKVLDDQIKLLEENDLEIENTIALSKKGFSLLGWLFK